MTADDEMREDFHNLEMKLDGLQRQVDELPTSADLSGFATKDDLARFATKDDLARFATKDDLTQFATKNDLIEFKDEIIRNFRVLSEDAKESVQKAAEGYGATLDRIERDLGDLNRKVDAGFEDHARTFADHNKRLVRLERERGS